MKNRKTLLVFTLLFSLFLFGYAAYFIGNGHHIQYQKRKAAWPVLKKMLIREIKEFKGDAGIVVKDLNMNLEFSFNKDRLFPSASLAKVPIMAACFDAAREGRLKLDDTVKLKISDKMSGSGDLKDMHPGVEFTIEELIGRMIYDSDNTATNILTNTVGIDYLNDKFKEFGLKNTSLSRKIADYKSRKTGIENYTTTEDMALILENIYRGTLVNKNISDDCLRLLKLQKISDRIPKYLPVEVIVAHKTGLEKGVCHDIGIVFSKKGNFLICVLTKHSNSNSAPSKEFIAKIALKVYSYFE